MCKNKHCREWNAPIMWRFLTSTAVFLAAAAAINGIPLGSFKAPSELVQNYQVFTPKVREFRSQDGDMGFNVEIAQYRLHLKLNKELLHPNFTSLYFDEDREVVVDNGKLNCFYHGKVEGHDDWQVAMSTCHGLQGSFGNPGRKILYHVEPLKAKDTKLDQPHALYWDEESSNNHRRCNNPRGKQTMAPSEVNVSYRHVLMKHRQRRQVNGFYLVELGIINDEAQFNGLDRNLTLVLMRSLAIVSYMDMVYKPLNIRVLLVSVETWTNGSLFPLPSSRDARAMLENLSGYVSNVSKEVDAHLLITGQDLQGETLGSAFRGQMCDSLKSVALVYDKLSSIEEVGSHASHELGHLLNMAHDDGRHCTCSDPTGMCVMTAVSAHPPPTHWSSCSISDLASGFKYKELHRCLHNEPEAAAIEPVCGNGYREIGEVCDCGTSEECTNPCCNASTCQLNEHAQCSEGPCCSEMCKFLSADVSCRLAEEECDIVEHCLGNSSDCPRDLHKQDGSICGNQGSDYCFSGICQTLNRHCHRFFFTMSSVKECYTEYNTAGSGHGNCGTQNRQFLPCAPEHAQCGRLMCDGGTFQKLEATDPVMVASRTVLVGSTFETCTSFSSSSSSLKANNLGLVPDGIKCGKNAVCMSQKCTQLQSLDHIQPCPVGQNGLTCSGNGVCNNHNQCSCASGIQGVSCEDASSSTFNIVPSASEETGVHLLALIAAAGISLSL